MAKITANNSITVAAGSTITFCEGGIGQAILDGNIYTLGMSDVFLGPFASAETIQVLVTSGPINYYTVAAPAAGANMTPVFVDPLTGYMTPRSGAVFVPAVRFAEMYRERIGNNPIENAVMAAPPTITVQGDTTPFGAMTRYSYKAAAPVAGFSSADYFTWLGAPKGSKFLDNASLGSYAQPRGPRANKSANMAYNFGAWMVGFRTDSPVVKPLLMGGNGNRKYRCVVDDQFTQAQTSYYVCSNWSETGVTSQGLLMDFTGVGGGKSREVWIDSWGDQAFGGVEIQEGYSIEPVMGRAPMVLVISDSYFGSGLGETNGVAFGVYPFAENICNTARYLTGWDIVSAGMTSTGYITRANVGDFDSVEQMWDYRLEDCAGTEPDAISVMMGYNDRVSTLLPADVTDRLRRVRAAFPNVPIHVGGPWPGVENFSARIVATELAIEAGVAAMADPLIEFVPTIRRGDPWLTGAASQGTPAGATGNSRYLIGYDNIHPTRRGALHHARRWAEDFLAAMQSMT